MALKAQGDTGVTLSFWLGARRGKEVTAIVMQITESKARSAAELIERSELHTRTEFQL